MIYWVINIVADTKTTDIYDAVAINKFPIVFVGDIDCDEVLGNEDFIDCVKNNIKTQHTYEKSKLYMRQFDEEEMIQELIIDIMDKIKLEFDHA